MNIVRWLSGVSGVLVLLVSSANANIINVPGDYDTIQEAVLAAQSDDEVVANDACGARVTGVRR